jgi:competence protein ComGC
MIEIENPWGKKEEWPWDWRGKKLTTAKDPEHTLARLTVVAVVIVALLLIGSTPIAEAPGVTSGVNGCAANVDLINTQVELYYAHTGEWPATLDVVRQDTDHYFPDGPPK